MMGAKVFAIICIVAILTFVGVNSFIVDQRMEDIINEVKKCESYKDVTGAREKFMEYERYINITVNHEDLTLIEDLFSQYEAEMRDESDDAEITKSRLINALTHLRRLSGINIDSVI